MIRVLDSESDEQREGQKDSITLEDHAAPPLIHSRPYPCWASAAWIFVHKRNPPRFPSHLYRGKTGQFSNPLIVQQSTISMFETFVWIAPSPFLPFSWGKYRLQVSPQNNQTISASPFSPGEGESKFCKLSNMIPKSCRTRKGTSTQYQWCYLDLVIWFYLSAQPIILKWRGGNAV